MDSHFTPRLLNLFLVSTHTLLSLQSSTVVALSTAAPSIRCGVLIYRGTPEPDAPIKEGTPLAALALAEAGREFVSEFTLFELLPFLPSAAYACCHAPLDVLLTLYSCSLWCTPPWNPATMSSSP
jgi:hypothetical protein